MAEPKYAISSRHLGMSATSSSLNSVPVFVVAVVLGLVIMVDDNTVAAVVVGLIAADDEDDEGADEDEDEDEFEDEASKYRSMSVLSSLSAQPLSSGVNLSKAAEWVPLGSTVRT